MEDQPPNSKDMYEKGVVQGRIRKEDKPESGTCNYNYYYFYQNYYYQQSSDELLGIFYGFFYSKVS
jgi:hypothetical protein